VDTQILTATDQLAPYIDTWDNLAVSRSEPYCAPGWMLPWWEHAAPAGAQLRVVVVTDKDRLVGVAPLFVERTAIAFNRYRILGAGLSGSVNLLAEPGTEAEVGAAFAAALATVEPRAHVLLFEGLPTGSPWPRIIGSSSGAGRGIATVEYSAAEPIATLLGLSFDEWFADKSHHFRQQMRRRRRGLEKAGGAFDSVADFSDEEVERCLSALVDLHLRRWESRGESALAVDGMVEMLMDSYRRSKPERFRIWSFSADDEPIACLVGLCAGEDLALWNHGFSDDWRKYSPAVLAFIEAIQDACREEKKTVSFGPGDQNVKYRFSDSERSLEWISLAMGRRHVPLARIQMLKQRTRLAIAERVSPKYKAAVRRLRSRLHSGGSGDRS
jgi:CelD/BcsL family acetyltransferase involved in cellulose biosynthesis